VTQNDIAAANGVSQYVVSHALRGSGCVAAETRRRIQKSARALGYRPNASARAMRAGEFGAVSLVLSSSAVVKSPLPANTLQGICEAFDERDINLTIAHLPDEKLTDGGFVPRIIREYCCDGMLINYAFEIPDRMISLVDSLQQPVIWMNLKNGRDCVYLDDIAIGRMATQRLLKAGHRRIAYVDSVSWRGLDRAHYSRHDRQSGYEHAMKAAGLNSHVIRLEESTLSEHKSRPGLMARIRELVAGDCGVTGFVTYSAEKAWMVAASLYMLGLSVPGDVSLVTADCEKKVIDDHRYVETVMIPSYEYGRAAAEAMLAKLKTDGDVTLSPRVVKPTDVASGATVAPPPERTR
jgi:LacI family transcriptional regulator